MQVRAYIHPGAAWRKDMFLFLKGFRNFSRSLERGRNGGNRSPFKRHEKRELLARRVMECRACP
jgi:hypothetical protein